ncbi:MAG: host-nuclease inhibitor Gam family protein [Roseococcus sp.]|nr:host-nuclease inhibitor Gam family protein [Roseococcus sp.]
MAKSNRTRLKAPALPIVAPADAEAAAVMVARMGAIGRDLVVAKAAMEEEIAAIKEEASNRAAPMTAELERLRAGVQAWADANRDTLTRGGRTKTVHLTTGKLEWRHLPPSVRVTSPEAVLELVQKMALEKFLRRKVELDREAMKASPQEARAIPGVTIGSAGEEFVVTPDAEELVT